MNQTLLEPRKFEIKSPDYQRNPLTGMGRPQWLDLCQFIMDGLFQNVYSATDPIQIPKQHEITYPQPDHPEWRFKAAEFEGLARTFMVAAPLLLNRPNASAGGHNLRDFYANQILLATDRSSPNYLMNMDDLIGEYGVGQYQHSVEVAALVICLLYTKEMIWNRYSQQQKNQIAEFLSTYAHARTTGHNWRFFNLMVLSFLKTEGYPVDEACLKDHITNLLCHYNGDGWYRDRESTDFYIAWAYQFYGPLWCKYYGYQHEPELAALIERWHNEFLQSYGLLFSRCGHQLMWGRSILYRCAASVSFGAAFLLRNTTADPGWSRRIASGNLLQFFERDDIYLNGVPCLGYYGPFGPMVQFYSCGASPFWFAKTFVALALEQDSPFWTATEGEGIWTTLHGKSHHLTLACPGLAISNFAKSGTSEIRPAKVSNRSFYYNRLAFNTDFPCEEDCPGGAIAMAYSVWNLDQPQTFTSPVRTGYLRHDKDVFYRQQDYGNMDGPARIDLADIAIDSGIIRVDRPRIPLHHELHLGHYAIPHARGCEPEVSRSMVADRPVIIVAIPGRQVALVAYAGWDAVDVAAHQNLHPEAEFSTVAYARRHSPMDYPGLQLAVSIMLHKTDDSPWSEEELSPIVSFEQIDLTESGSILGARLTLRDQRCVLIDFGQVEGHAIY